MTWWCSVRARTRRRQRWGLLKQKAEGELRLTLRPEKTRITRRLTHRTLQEVIAVLNPVIRGWGNYFRLSHMKERFKTLDQ